MLMSDSFWILFTNKNDIMGTIFAPTYANWTMGYQEIKVCAIIRVMLLAS